MNTRLVGTVIVNWNGLKDTLECLESLTHLTYPNHMVTVVDNGSVDGSAAWIRRSFPEVDVVELPDNQGFAYGCNVGIKRVLGLGADTVFLLNNDTTVDPDAISVMMRSLYRSDHIGVVNPTTYYYDEPTMVWSAGGAVDVRTGVSKQLHYKETARGQLGEEREVDYAVGAAMLIRREVFETAGLLDTDFFVYYEETEWCLRARDKGYCCYYVPDAAIMHKVSRSLSNSSELLDYYFSRNRLMFLKKRGAGISRLMRISTVDLGRMGLTLMLKGRRKYGQMVLKGTVDFWLGKKGKIGASQADKSIIVV